MTITIKKKDSTTHDIIIHKFNCYAQAHEEQESMHTPGR